MPESKQSLLKPSRTAASCLIQKVDTREGQEQSMAEPPDPGATNDRRERKDQWVRPAKVSSRRKPRGSKEAEQSRGGLPAGDSFSITKEGTHCSYLEGSKGWLAFLPLNRHTTSNIRGNTASTHPKPRVKPPDFTRSELSKGLPNMLPFGHFNIPWQSVRRQCCL